MVAVVMMTVITTKIMFGVGGFSCSKRLIPLFSSLLFSSLLVAFQSICDVTMYMYYIFKCKFIFPKVLRRVNTLSLSLSLSLAQYHNSLAQHYLATSQPRNFPHSRQAPSSQPSDTPIHHRTHATRPLTQPNTQVSTSKAMSSFQTIRIPGGISKLKPYPPRCFLGLSKRTNHSALTCRHLHSTLASRAGPLDGFRHHIGALHAANSSSCSAAQQQAGDYLS
ncbi:hypothetical protein B0J11DRAFT_133637 [Dendryphion nanum]|uniref:Uncharacterized protein n=1 Tax=Dendryphion nanum TaxID=256645 RepID=A0A9P9D8D4_9PLEO|nr:hypothetical protein B0J11DRAFT_133637 [Dendryphion nanum]